MGFELIAGCKFASPQAFFAQVLVRTPFKHHMTKRLAFVRPVETFYNILILRIAVFIVVVLD